MVVGEVINEIPDLGVGINTLIRILQIILGVFGFYVIFWVINFFVNRKRVKLLKEILEKIEEINKKIKK